MKIKEVAEWINLGDIDFESAKILKNTYGSSREIAYYHCAQAIEKYLKSYIISKEGFFNFDHNLNELYKECLNYDPIFEKIKTNCFEVNQTSGNLRYPSRINVDITSLNYGYNSAKLIKDYPPIKELRIIIEDKYSSDWKRKLFNGKSIEIQQIFCIDHEIFSTSFLNERLKSLHKLTKIEEIGKYVSKYEYINEYNKKEYLLLQKRPDGKSQLWYLSNDFNKLSALEYIKKFDLFRNSIITAKTESAKNNKRLSKK